MPRSRLVASAGTCVRGGLPVARGGPAEAALCWSAAGGRSRVFMFSPTSADQGRRSDQRPELDPLSGCPRKHTPLAGVHIRLAALWSPTSGCRLVS